MGEAAKEFLAGYFDAKKKLASAERICREHAHPGCEPGKHELAEKILAILSPPGDE